jgi:hypothetical protein
MKTLLAAALLLSFSPGPVFADAIRFYVNVRIGEAVYSSVDPKSMEELKAVAAGRPCLARQLEAVALLQQDAELHRILGDVPAFVQVHAEISYLEANLFRVVFYDQPTRDPNLARYVTGRKFGAGYPDAIARGSCPLPDMGKIRATAAAVRLEIDSLYR